MAARGTPDENGLRIRPAVRALVVDERDRVLLVRLDFPGDPVWVTPGGGIDPGETPHEALARELVEEIGLAGAEIGPPLWRRRHVTRFGRWDGQEETVHLVRVRAFTAAPALSPEQLAAEHVTAIRWWTPAELAADTTSTFAPRRLVELVAAVLADGPPTVPHEVGV